MLGTVHVVDDDNSARQALARLLSLSGYQVCTYEAGQQLLDSPLGDARGPGCILLDLRMSGLNGLEVLERLATRDHPPVIMVSGHGDIAACATAMKAGALDFLEKPVDAAQLRSVVDKALAEHVAAQAATLAKAKTRQQIDTLTPREQEVLRHIISGRLNKVIAADLHISEKTVKVHRARVLEKMQVRSVAELTRFCTLAGVEPAERAEPLQAARKEKVVPAAV